MCLCVRRGVQVRQRQRETSLMTCPLRVPARRPPGSLAPADPRAGESTVSGPTTCKDSAGSQDHLNIGSSAKNNVAHHPKHTAPVLHPGLCRGSETLRSLSSSEAYTLIQPAVSNEVTLSFPGAGALQPVLLVPS